MASVEEWVKQLRENQAAYAEALLAVALAIIDHREAERQASSTRRRLDEAQKHANTLKAECERNEAELKKLAGWPPQYRKGGEGEPA